MSRSLTSRTATTQQSKWERCVTVRLSKQKSDSTKVGKVGVSLPVGSYLLHPPALRSKRCAEDLWSERKAGTGPGRDPHPSGAPQERPQKSRSLAALGGRRPMISCLILGAQLGCGHHALSTTKKQTNRFIVEIVQPNKLAFPTGSPPHPTFRSRRCGNPLSLAPVSSHYWAGLRAWCWQTVSACRAPATMIGISGLHPQHSILNTLQRGIALLRWLSQPTVTCKDRVMIACLGRAVVRGGCNDNSHAIFFFVIVHNGLMAEARHMSKKLHEFADRSNKAEFRGQIHETYGRNRIIARSPRAPRSVIHIGSRS